MKKNKRLSHNIALKRDAPYRGGYEGLCFFRLYWLRQSSVTGAPLSFTLDAILMDAINEELIEASDAISNNEFEKALAILRPLADKEVAGALGLLGVMYQLGEGVDLNGLKAVELLTRAMELGDGTSAHNLGTIYGMGLPGIAKDHDKCKLYYRKAKEMGAQFAPDSFYE
ncbi:MAG: hypothetical protein ABL933_02415 [Methyloglobulus sp.]